MESAVTVLPSILVGHNADENTGAYPVFSSAS
jgi:hypothetical protein